MKCRVIDDTHGFDYPAEFKIDHEQFDSVVCFTATYTGQAIKGEIVEVSGIVEQTRKALSVSWLAPAAKRSANISR